MDPFSLSIETVGQKQKAAEFSLGKMSISKDPKSSLRTRTTEERASNQASLIQSLISATPDDMISDFEQPGKAEAMLKNLYAGMKGASKPQFETAPTNEKFTSQILDHVAITLPVIPLTLGYYDGFTDPEDFLQKYEGIARNQRRADETKCLELPPLLEGVSRQ